MGSIRIHDLHSHSIDAEERRFTQILSLDKNKFEFRPHYHTQHINSQDAH